MEEDVKELYSLLDGPKHGGGELHIERADSGNHFTEHLAPQRWLGGKIDD
jgi:hypothetical protein